jgi:hypothetical protein
MIAIGVMEDDNSGPRLRRIVVLSSFEVLNLNPGGQGRPRPQPNVLGRRFSSASSQRKARDPV